MNSNNNFFTFIISLLIGLATIQAKAQFEPQVDPEQKFSQDYLNNKHEVIDYRSGDIYWETTDLELKGIAGMDILVSRSFNKVRTPQYASLGSWEIEVPRILMTGINGSSVLGFGTFNLDRRGACGQPQSWLALKFPVTGGGFITVPFQYHTGIELIILGEAPKPLLFRKPVIFSETLSNNFPSEIDYVTTDNWVVKCFVPEGDTEENGFLVTSPAGVRYKMDVHSAEYGIITKLIPGPISNGLDFLSHITVSASEMTDRYNNWVRYHYSHYSTRGEPSQSLITKKLINQITASDGRLINFSHTTGARPYIDEMQVFGVLNIDTIIPKIWDYQYIGKYLSKVVNPDGSEWQFLNNGPEIKSIGYLRGFFSSYKHLSRLSTPQGGEIEYSYISRAIQELDQKSKAVSHLFTALKTTISNDRNDNSLTKTFSYLNNTSHNYTTLTYNDIRREQKFDRVSNTLRGSLLQEKIYDNNQLIRTIDYSWHALPQIGSDLLSIPTEIFAETPRRLSSQTINGTFTTTWSNFDAFANPRTVNETGVDAAGTVARQTTYTYFNNTDYANDKWLIGFPEDETIVGGGTVDRTYNSLGQIVDKNEYGIAETYEYHASGDLHKVKWFKDAGGPELETVYTDYKFGIPQTETQADGSTITRNVSPYFALVLAETNEQGDTTYYQYDFLDRLKKTTPPLQLSTQVEWLPSPFTTGAFEFKRETQGNNVKEIFYDGFSRETLQREYDTSTSIKYLSRSTSYDEYGRVHCRSLPFYQDPAATPAINSASTCYQYDALDRPTHIDNTGWVSKYYYGADWNTFAGASHPQLTHGHAIVDPRGYAKVHHMQSYGSPDEQSLVQLDEQLRKQTEVGGLHYVSTEIDRNLLDAITAVRQGGLERRWNYYSNRPQLIEEEISPEVGSTDFTYDLVGNKKTETISGTAAVTYSYDALNRLDFIDYPTATNDIDYEYYPTGDLKFIDTVATRRDYVYNKDRQLTQESLNLGSDWLAIVNYGYNSQGRLSDMTYPDGEQLTFAPDALGRASQLGHYARGLTYHANGKEQYYQLANGKRMLLHLNQQQATESITSNGTCLSGTATTCGHVMKYGYLYDSVGNVKEIFDFENPVSSASRLASYDGLSRLNTVESSAWGGMHSYSYDDVGNILQKATPQSTLNYTVNTVTNKLSSTDAGHAFSYDAFGNVTDNGTDTFNYNRAGSLINVSNQGINYLYDGSGNRVLTEKTTGGGEKTYYFYSKAGVLLHSYDENAQTTKNYIYLGSSLLATRERCDLQDTDSDGIPDCVEKEMGLNHNDASDGALDADGDSLSNLAEYLAGTNHQRGDTDTDGIPDDYELNNALNPITNDAQEDFDGDGLNNEDEFLAGTRANNMDTDGDGVIDPQEIAQGTNPLDGSDVHVIVSVLPMLVYGILFVLLAIIGHMRLKVFSARVVSALGLFFLFVVGSAVSPVVEATSVTVDTSPFLRDVSDSSIYWWIPPGSSIGQPYRIDESKKNTEEVGTPEYLQVQIDTSLSSPNENLLNEELIYLGVHDAINFNGGVSTVPVEINNSNGVVTGNISLVLSAPQAITWDLDIESGIQLNNIFIFGNGQQTISINGHSLVVDLGANTNVNGVSVQYSNSSACGYLLPQDNQGCVTDLIVGINQESIDEFGDVIDTNPSNDNFLSEITPLKLTGFNGAYFVNKFIIDIDTQGSASHVLPSPTDVDTFANGISYTPASAASLAKGVITYHHNDALGSPVAATNRFGHVKWHEHYEPFGERIDNDTHADSNNVWYTGKPQDKETGLVYMNARYYDPSIGRFYAQDPVGFTAENPMSFNRYLYVNNNPYKYNDPEGEFLNNVVGGAFAAVQNAGVQHIEIALGLRSSFSFGELALETAAGALTSGLSATRSTAKLGRLAGKLSRASKGAPQSGDKVFRVFGENNNPLGESFTRIDPRTVDDFRDTAGLPDVNTGRFVLEGTLKNTKGVTTRKALPLDGNGGGLDEVLIPDAKSQVRIDRVSGANSEF